MKSLLIIFLFCLNSYCLIDGAEVAQCTALNFNLTVSLKSEGKINLLLAYSGDVAVSAADPFHSNINLTNLGIWSTNSSVYYQSDALYFNDLQYSWLICPNGSGCNITVLDGYSFFELPTMFNGDYRTFGILEYLVIDQGTLIDNDGYSFDPILKPCMSFTESHTDPLVIQWSYCCTNYTYVNVPDEDTNPCTELMGTTMFIDANSNIVSLLKTTYGITSSGLNVTLTTNLIQPPFTQSVLYPNYVNYDCVSNSTSSCNILLKRGLATNSLYNMIMSLVTVDDQREVIPSIKIIKRNGIYLKNDYTLFTPNDSCSSVTTPIIYGYRSLNTLCCSKFLESAKENSILVQSKRQFRRPKSKGFKQFF